MSQTRPIIARERVRVRTAQEILATVDAEGYHEGIPFMREMLEHIDQEYEVSNRVTKICWYTPESSTRRLDNTLLLEDLRCNGSGHNGCQAECRIYFKDAWLDRVDDSEPPPRSDPAAVEELRRRVERGARGQTTEDGRHVFRCQITESRRASAPLAEEPKQYVDELRFRNVTLMHWLSVVWRMFWWRVLSRLGRRPALPVFAGKSRVDGEKLDLMPGELVEVRSLDEIGLTLDSKGRHRGLAWSEEMSFACGKQFRVKGRIEKFINEHDGTMLQLKNDCIVLEGFVCTGDRAWSAWFCPRQALPLFREAWLKRVPVPDSE